jgi:hypothetical protein
MFMTKPKCQVHISCSGGARTRAGAIYSPTEAESKDLLEPERMKVVENLQS